MYNATICGFYKHSYIDRFLKGNGPSWYVIIALKYHKLMDNCYKTVLL